MRFISEMEINQCHFNTLTTKKENHLVISDLEKAFDISFFIIIFIKLGMERNFLILIKVTYKQTTFNIILVKD